MKIIIISPIVDLLFSKVVLQELASHGELVLIKDIIPFANITELYDDEPKIVAIDPDFCGWKVSKEIINEFKNVRAICLQTTSFSRIDTQAAKNNNIPVINLRGFSTEAVAEWAIMMLFNVARKLPLVIKDSWNQDFNKHQGIELKGKTAGIIGLGTIGKRIAELCKAIGMNVQYRSRNTKDDRFSYASLEDVMSTSDVIFPTLARNEETISLITDEMLQSMKKSTIFVSVGKVYNHALVTELAKANSIYGYAFESGKEKITDFEGNIRAGPELGRCTAESLTRNAEQRANAIIDATKEIYTNQVNN